MRQWYQAVIVYCFIETPLVSFIPRASTEILLFVFFIISGFQRNMAQK